MQHTEISLYDTYIHSWQGAIGVQSGPYYYIRPTWLDLGGRVEWCAAGLCDLCEPEPGSSTLCT